MLIEKAKVENEKDGKMLSRNQDLNFLNKTDIKSLLQVATKTHWRCTEKVI